MRAAWATTLVGRVEALVAHRRVRYALIGLAGAFLLVQGTTWAARKAERYVYDVALPRVLAQAKGAATEAMQDGIRSGASGALNEMTGGILGRPGPLTGDRGLRQSAPGPCQAPTPPSFGLPGLFPRLSQ